MLNQKSTKSEIPTAKTECRSYMLNVTLSCLQVRRHTIKKKATSKKATYKSWGKYDKPFMPDFECFIDCLDSSNMDILSETGYEQEEIDRLKSL